MPSQFFQIKLYNICAATSLFHNYLSMSNICYFSINNISTFSSNLCKWYENCQV